MIMCIQNLVKLCPVILKILSKNQILVSIKDNSSVANLRKMTLYKPNVDLVNDNVKQNLVKLCPFILKIWNKNQIKGRDSVANLRKMTLYNSNVDIVNDNVYTKFGLNPSIRFQDIEQKPNSDVNQGL